VDKDLYAIIRLDASLDKAEVARAVAGIAGGLAAGETVVTDWAEMLVTDGEEFGGAESAGGACRDFRYCLEIEPLGNIDAMTFKVKTASLLAELKEAGFRADAYHAFERNDEGGA